MSASCASRSKDVQAMSLPRKSGGRVLQCFSRERSDSSKSAVTPGRGWCLCVCRGNWCMQRRTEEWETQGSVAGGRVLKSYNVKLIFSAFTSSVADVLLLGFEAGKKSNV